MKDYLSQKNTWNYDIFCISRKDGISISYKSNIALTKKKAKMIFSRKIHLKLLNHDIGDVG